MSKRELLIKKPTDNNVDCIYVINNYSSGFDEDNILNTYRSTPIGMSKEEVADINNTKTAINPTELYAYDTIRDIKNLRTGFNTSQMYGLDELYLISTALKNNIGLRLKRYETTEYFNTLNDWNKELKSIDTSESNQELDISEYKSHLYMSRGETDIYCNIRGVEFRYTHHHDQVLDLHFYILPPDIFKYNDVYNVIDKVEIRHNHYHKNGDINIYPKVSYFKWEYNTDNKKWSSEDITTELTNQINNMNLIK